MAVVTMSVRHAIAAGGALSRRLCPTTHAPPSGPLLHMAIGYCEFGPLHYRDAVAHRGRVLGTAEHATEAPRACHCCVLG